MFNYQRHLCTHWQIRSAHQAPFQIVNLNILSMFTHVCVLCNSQLYSQCKVVSSSLNWPSWPLFNSNSKLLYYWQDFCHLHTWGSCITQVFSENCNTDITLILQSLLDNHDERCLKIFQFLLIFCWEVSGLFEHPALHHSTDWSCVQNIKTSAQKLTQTSTWL